MKRMLLYFILSLAYANVFAQSNISVVIEKFFKNNALYIRTKVTNNNDFPIDLMNSGAYSDTGFTLKPGVCYSIFTGFKSLTDSIGTRSEERLLIDPLSTPYNTMPSIILLKGKSYSFENLLHDHPYFKGIFPNTLNHQYQYLKSRVHLTYIAIIPGSFTTHTIDIESNKIVL